MFRVRTSLALSLLVVAVACDGGRATPSPGPGSVRRDGGTSGDGSTADGSSTANDGSTAGDGSTGRDAGRADAFDAGPCTVGPVQATDQQCCPTLGPDACAPRNTCAALDGRTIAVCYADGSRTDGQGCTDDVQCISGACAAGRCTPRARFTTSAEILAFLEGVTLVEEGANIPSHPQGYSEDVNYGSATQCYSGITVEVRSGQVHQQLVFGSLEGAPTTGSVGTCNRGVAVQQIDVTSTALDIRNIQGDAECFDIDITFAGYGLQGRGRIMPGAREVQLEVYFRDQAVGMRCADGLVGAPRTVQLNGMPFTGDAVQRFDVR